MNLQKLRNINKSGTEKISYSILYTMIAVIIIGFGFFFLVGFDTPYTEDATFTAPLFTDVVLILCYLLLLLAFVALVYSAVHSSKVRSKTSGVINNVPVRKISLFTTIVLVLSLVGTFILGSSEALLINGKSFTNIFWLKTADMFINSSLILMFVALCGVLFGLSGRARKIKL